MRQMSIPDLAQNLDKAEGIYGAVHPQVLQLSIYRVTLAEWFNGFAGVQLDSTLLCQRRTISEPAAAPCLVQPWHHRCYGRHHRCYCREGWRQGETGRDSALFSAAALEQYYALVLDSTQSSTSSTTWLLTFFFSLQSYGFQVASALIPLSQALYANGDMGPARETCTRALKILQASYGAKPTVEVGKEVHRSRP